MSEIATLPQAEETTKHRTPQEIDAEYAQVCSHIGDLAVKRLSFDEAEEECLKKVRSLNVEMLNSKAYFTKIQADLEAKKNETSQS